MDYERHKHPSTLYGHPDIMKLVWELVRFANEGPPQEAKKRTWVGGGRGLGLVEGETGGSWVWGLGFGCWGLGVGRVSC